MSEPSEKSHKNRRSHFVSVLSETWKETEFRDVIIFDLVGTAMTLSLALIFQVVGREEIKELIFLAFVGGLCGIIISFAYRFIFVAPANLHGELESQLEIAESKLNERLAVKPLLVEALPPHKKSVHTHFLYECEISVLNENQVASGVKLKLLPPILMKIK
jgi:hypothetical protein